MHSRYKPHLFVLIIVTILIYVLFKKKSEVSSPNEAS